MNSEHHRDGHGDDSETSLSNPSHALSLRRWLTENWHRGKVGGAREHATFSFTSDLIDRRQLKR
jgi:hypothetical protein